MLQAGQVIDRYELICPIGDGGMAHVWAARQHGKHGFEKHCALKVIHSRFAEDPTFRSMFLDEARICSAITHRNVAAVSDLGEANRLLYLVFELIEGDSLFALTAPKRVVPIPVALRIAADVCAGLHAAHSLVDAQGQSLNVVHRDVSPQNILISVHGDVKLIDFGIAKARDRVAMATDASQVKGKVRYMAPEQAHRAALGPQTDVFGAGAVLFRMLAGHAPYAAESELTTMQSLLAYAPPPRTLPPEVPAAVVEIVQRAIAPYAQHRFASAKDMQMALEGLLAQMPAPPVASWVTSSLGEATRQRLAQIGRPGSSVDLPRTHVAPTEPLAPPIALPASAGTVPLMAPLHSRLASPDTAGESPQDRSFMDVGALAAKAGQPAPPLAPPPAQAPPPPDARSQPVGAGFGAKPNVVPSGAIKPAPPPSSNTAMKAAIGAIVVVVLLVVVMLSLPSIAKEKAIASARDAGFELKVEKVGVGFGGTSLRGVTAHGTRVAGVHFTAEEIFLPGLGNDARVTGLNVALFGARADVEVALSMLVADNRARMAGKPNEPRHYSIVNAKVNWTGKGSDIAADTAPEATLGGVSVEVDSKGPGVEEVKGTIGRIDYKNPDTKVGPWELSFELGPARNRIRLLLDPAVPDGPSALYVWGKNIPDEVTVKIPRGPFTNLGFKPDALGLPAKETSELEVKVTAKSTAAANEAKFELGLFKTTLPGGIDLRAEGSARGTAGKPLDLERTVVFFGPFTTGASGTITPSTTGIRLDWLLKSLPTPCEKVQKGTFGTVNVSGVLKVDTAVPLDNSVNWLTKDGCGVSIFAK